MSANHADQAGEPTRLDPDDDRPTTGAEAARAPWPQGRPHEPGARPEPLSRLLYP